MLDLRKRIAVAAALALPLLAPAHEGGQHARGTVRAITADRIVVVSQGGKAAEFALTPETSFQRGDAAVRREDVKVGERAVVHGRHVAGHEVADVVKLGHRTP